VIAETPAAAKLRRVIEEIYARGTIRDAEGIEHQIFPESVTPDRGAFLRDTCRQERAGSVLEIGMAWGLSTLHIQEGLLSQERLLSPDAGAHVHVVIDPKQTSKFHCAGRRILRDAGVEQRVEFHEDYSEFLLPRLVCEGRVFDLVFIDGAHRFDNVFVDLFYANRLLKPGGVVVFDDVFAESVNLACRFARTNYGYIPAAQHPAAAPAFDDDSAPADWRPVMVALRKPAEEVPLALFQFVPFFPIQPQGEQKLAEPAKLENPSAPRTSAELEASKSEAKEEIDPDAQPSYGRARASELRRNARLALHEGDRAAARRDFVKALRLDPFRLKAYTGLVKTFLP
jgi:predicted O-methyltransferase YrrM